MDPNKDLPSAKWTSSLTSKDKKISFSSKRKIFWAAILVAIISPLAGLILSIAFWPEADLKKEARLIAIFSIIWGAIFYYKQIVNLDLFLFY